MQASKLSDKELFTQLRERMLSIYGDYFFDAYNNNPESELKYRAIIQSYVGRSILCRMYDEFLKVKEPDFAPLESLEEDQKNVYWSIAIKYFQDKPSRIEACKTMYVMDWITGTFKQKTKN